MGSITSEQPLKELAKFIKGGELARAVQNHDQIVLVDYTGQVQVHEQALEAMVPKTVTITSIRSTAARPKELDYQYITPTAYAGQWHIENDFIRNCCKSIVNNLRSFLNAESEQKNFFIVFIEKEAKQGRQDSVHNPYFNLDEDERKALRALLQETDHAIFILDNHS